MEERNQERRFSQNFIDSLLIAMAFLFLIWAVKLLESRLGMDLRVLGIYPRSFDGLIGIWTSPFVHKDFEHLLSNSFPIVVLSLTIFYFYKKVAVRVFLLVYILTGLLVWLMARPAYHIGASGLIYGFAFFLFFSGMLRADRRSLAISLLVIFFYGGLIWGILPLDSEVSWEAHLFGALTGSFGAYLYRNVNPPPRPEPNIPVHYHPGDKREQAPGFRYGYIPEPEEDADHNSDITDSH